MTREARLTQQRLEGEILKLLEGKSGRLRNGGDCAFCEKYPGCQGCPIKIAHPTKACATEKIMDIHMDMGGADLDAIPGALAIYMWLEEL